MTDIFRIGDEVQSTWDKKLKGIVIGYGAVSWPQGNELSGDGGVMHQTLLVQVSQGSSALGSACRVLRSDRVQRVEA